MAVRAIQQPASKFLLRYRLMNSIEKIPRRMIEICPSAMAHVLGRNSDGNRTAAHVLPVPSLRIVLMNTGMAIRMVTFRTSQTRSASWYGRAASGANINSVGGVKTNGRV